MRAGQPETPAAAMVAIRAAECFVMARSTCGGNATVPVVILGAAPAAIGRRRGSVSDYCCGLGSAPASGAALEPCFSAVPYRNWLISCSNTRRSGYSGSCRPRRNPLPLAARRQADILLAQQARGQGWRPTNRWGIGRRFPGQRLQQPGRFCRQQSWKPVRPPRRCLTGARTFSPPMLSKLAVS